MLPKHSNPTKFRNDRNAYGFWARAPYNFVPLPEVVVSVKEEKIPTHDRYDENSALYTGVIRCTLKTETPLYTRTALRPSIFAELQKKIELDWADKEKMAPFFSLDNGLSPVIPGSSLRGMIRTLVEIMAFSKMNRVADTPKFTFRAVAASKNDPLGKVYRTWMGNGSKVKAGYLQKKGETWRIRPALRPENVGWKDKKDQNERCFIPVRKASVRGVRNLIPFGDKDFKPQFHDVFFWYEKDRKNNLFVVVFSKKPSSTSQKGTLVVSGDMNETGQRQRRMNSPRKKYALIPDVDPAQKPVKIPPRVIEDYLDSLTEFQQSDPFDHHGVLKDGNPVFYVERNGKVAWIGHTPNFRIPAWIDEESRAVTPRDMVPKSLRKEDDVDITDAIFGYAPRKREDGTIDIGRAGRVFFTDANFLEAKTGIWRQSESITPLVLSEPKPTTFQHYLVQDKNKYHDPDNKITLAHWGTAQDETQIRGYKLYWHKQRPLAEELFVEHDQERIDRLHKQYTRMKPVDSDVSFEFFVYYENLRKWELGALLWALLLPGEKGKEYRHKLGMGKPLGMGTVNIEATLDQSLREERYKKLFAAEQWHEPKHELNPQEFIEAFQEYILHELKERLVDFSASSLLELDRIKMLFKMLEWPGPEADITRYMEIQYPDERDDKLKHNEFAERAVLPDPFHIDEPDYFLGLEKDMEVQSKVVFPINGGKHAGVTVSIEHHRQLGHIAKSQLNPPVRERKLVKDKYHKGKRLTSWVLYKQQQPKRIGLTLNKPSEPKKWIPQEEDSGSDQEPETPRDANFRPTPPESLASGVEVEGVILAIEHDRLSVDIGLEIDATLTYRKIPDVLNEEDARNRFDVGQRIRAKLFRTTRKGRWQLTMR